MVYNPKF